jgi:hypothetical protein
MNTDKIEALESLIIAYETAGDALPEAMGFQVAEICKASVITHVFVIVFRGH